MPTSRLKFVWISALLAGCPASPPPTATTTTTTTTIKPAVDTMAVLEADEAALRPWLRDRLLAGDELPSGADPIALDVVDGGVVVRGRRGERWSIANDIVSAASGERADEEVDDVFHAGRVVVRFERLERRLRITVDDRETIVDFQGALFSMLERRTRDGVEIFVAGLEDAPLDRSGGSFGNIDSFLFRIDVDDGGAVSRRWSLNLSAAGVVTPKALAFVLEPEPRDGSITCPSRQDIAVVGAGNGTLAIVDDDTGEVRDVVDGLVGGTDIVATGARSVAVVSPIADAVAFIDLDSGARRLVPIVDAAHPRADDLARLGELLVFSTALAPEQSSDGPLSRFTCEACHFAGGVDGRVHGTGRFDGGDEVLATTRPLTGLFQNPPLFSRGLDESVAVMVHAEVGVANANSPRSPWTPLVVDLEAPFIRDVVADIADVVDPLHQRRAMLRFFATFGAPREPTRHDMHPGLARGRTLFTQHCQRCHQPRVFTNDVDSVVDPLLHPGAVTWAGAFHVDVGVRPLVHPDGARPASLRDVRHKRPLLTNGSAKDLSALVRQLRIADEQIQHDGDPARGTAFDDDDVEALVVFLNTL